MTDNQWWRLAGDSLYLDLHVQPGASRDEWAGRHGQRLKVRLRVRPVDGAANRGLLRFVAAECGVRSAQVELVSGASGRRKTVRVRGLRVLPAVLAVMANAGA